MQQTSLEAYKSIRDILGQSQSQVLHVFDIHPAVKDWTNLELARYLQWDPNRVTGRVYELRQLGILEESTTRPCKITGRTAIAWHIKEATQ
jgi:hypothetical protein